MVALDCHSKIATQIKITVLNIVKNTVMLQQYDNIYMKAKSNKTNFYFI